MASKGFTLNPNKCEFSRTSIDFFGLTFSAEGIAIQGSKIEALIGANNPKNASEVRSILGLANYCSRFIEHLATTVKPLNDLTKKKAKFEWTQTQAEALNKLKTTLTTTALSYFNKDWRTEITVDASPVGLGLVMAQYDHLDKESTRTIVQYASRTLSDVETRYSQVEKEALAVVWACEKLHLYLYGSEFDMVTDNKAIELIFGNAKSTPKARIERWCLRLLPYKFTIKHQPGAYNIADYLSRNPIGKTDSDDLEAVATKHVNLIINSAIPFAVSRAEIAQATESDPCLSTVTKWVQLKIKCDLGAFKQIKDELSVTEDGILIRGNRIVIPNSLQQKILVIAHQDHQGIVRTKQLVRKFVWFPNIDAMVENTIKHCQQCQIHTPRRHAIEPLSMSKMPDGPWEELSIDFFGPLKTGKYIMVLVDDYSRYPIALLITSTSAKTVIPALNEILSTFGIPSKIRSDNGPPLDSADINHFAKQQGFKHHRVTPLWPRANGICERFMKNLGKIIKNVSVSHNSLEGELCYFLRNYRATPHSSTGFPPNECDASHIYIFL